MHGMYVVMYDVLHATPLLLRVSNVMQKMMYFHSWMDGCGVCYGVSLVTEDTTECACACMLLRMLCTARVLQGVLRVCYYAEYVTEYDTMYDTLLFTSDGWMDDGCITMDGSRYME